MGYNMYNVTIDRGKFQIYWKYDILKCSTFLIQEFFINFDHENAASNNDKYFHCHSSLNNYHLKIFIKLCLLFSCFSSPCLSKHPTKNKHTHSSVSALQTHSHAKHINIKKQIKGSKNYGCMMKALITMTSLWNPYQESNAKSHPRTCAV